MAEPKAEYVSPGALVPYTPTSDVVAGDVIVRADFVGVAISNISANEEGVLLVQGLVRFPKGAGAMNAGSKAYWDNTNKVATLTATGNSPIGRVAKDAAAADTSVLVWFHQL